MGVCAVFEQLCVAGRSAEQVRLGGLLDWRVLTILHDLVGMCAELSGCSDHWACSAERAALGQVSYHFQAGVLRVWQA